MKRQLDPMWTKEEQKAAEKVRQAWENFFASEDGKQPLSSIQSDDPRLDSRIDETIERHQSTLLSLANVVAIARGVRMKQGAPTGEACITIYVERKLPESELAEKDILPKTIESLPVDVVEAGKIEAL